MLKSDSPTDSEEYAPLLDSSDPKPIFNLEDFLVAAESQMDARAPPSKLSELLKIQGIDIDSKRISTIARKLQSRNLMLPYLYFGLPGLSSNFCFEIICNDYWKSRILLTLNKFPWTMYYLSTRGIVVWILTPGNHQVEYYQLFRALEHKPGVSSIQSIMTISHRGSKSMYDLTRDLQYIDGQWSIEPGNLDIGDFIDY